MNIPKAKLEQVSAQLKSEFIGIDEIIDKLINIMASWNDNIVRPIVVPIFGMTGVGKTSVITRMIELLNLQDRTTNVPIGVSTKSSHDTRPAKVLLQSLGFADWENFKSITDVPEDSILIVDEIQQLRTKDEDGNEQDSEFNELYKIIDNGYVDYIPTGASEKARYEKCLQVLTKYVLPYYPDAIVENALTTDKGVVDTLMKLKFVTDQRKNLTRSEEEKEYKPISELNSFYQDSDRSFERIMDLTFEIVPNKDPEDEDTITLSMAPFRVREDMRSALNELSTPNRVEQFLTSITKKQTLREYCETFDDIIKFINSPHHISFRKSVIFLIGNLDEAFSMSKDLDPDVDADVFHRLTKDVNVNDVKHALLARFRSEQLARFGNNYIIYPAFSKDTFKQIIKRYWENDVACFSVSSNMVINYSPNILDLLYYEGVFPTQGIRPVLSTVSAFGFVFGEINGLRESNLNWKFNKADIELKSDDPEFKCDSATIHIKITDDQGNSKEKDITYPLCLGKLRNPKNDPNRYLKAVHELGHAIMTALETGKLPSSIITTSSADGGGFCMRNIDDIKRRCLSNIDSTISDIKIAMGGWVSERNVLPKELSSLGSSSDIKAIWDEISYAYFKGGYLTPIAFGRGERPDGVPLGFDDPEVMDKIQENIIEIKKDVEEKIDRYSPMIAWIASRLAEKGSYTEKELEKCIKDFTDENSKLGDEFQKEVREKLESRNKSDDTYLDILKKKAKSEPKKQEKNWLMKILSRFENNLD